MKRIYLDHAATTPIDKRIVKTMREFELKFYGNPNSIHREGQQARAAIDFARADISKFFACKPQEIIFTSSATESNNHAIQGTVAWAINEFKIKPHVITTELEHSSVYNLVRHLQKNGVIDATFIKPDAEGCIDPKQIIGEITEHTVLVSCIFVSNEIGSVLPIREIGKILSEVNSRRTLKVLFHTDAVQAVKFYNCNVEKLNVDLLTFSAHKINGPKGIGGLYIKAGTKINNLMVGGSQEYDKRPGTQNTAGIIGMADSFKFLGPLEARQKNGKKISKLKNILCAKLLDLNGIELNGTLKENLTCPDILSISVSNTDQETLITSLDLAGISASTGSACVSGSTEPSHVIRALGKNQNLKSTVRFSLSSKNTTSEINTLIKIISSIKHNG